MKHIKLFEQFINRETINETNWHSTDSKPIEHDSEIQDMLSKLVKLTPESKKIIKQYNLDPSLKIIGSHWSNDSGGITIQYNIGSDPAVTVMISFSILESGKNRTIVSGWKGKGVSHRKKYQDYITSMSSVKYTKMSELTLKDISNMLKNVAPEFNKYLNGNLELWAIGVSAEKAFYKDRNLGPGVGNQM